MMNEADQLSDKQKQYERKVMLDPVLFASHVLGADLWPTEVEILRSIKNIAVLRSRPATASARRLPSRWLRCGGLPAIAMEWF